MPTLLIRDMVHGDLGEAWRINQANVPAVGDETMTSFREIFEVSSVSLVVETDSQIAGFCMVLPPGTTYDSPNYLYFCDKFTSFATSIEWPSTRVIEGRVLVLPSIAKLNLDWTSII